MGSSICVIWFCSSGVWDHENEFFEREDELDVCEDENDATLSSSLSPPDQIGTKHDGEAKTDDLGDRGESHGGSLPEYYLWAS